MANVDFQARFPGMKPVSKAPGMHLINGIGTRVVGERDLDRETGAYITTLCFCILFVPIIPIRAYRVIKSPRGGWYFLGIEPLSALARAWNLALLLAVITAGISIGVSAYTSRPEYVAQQRMAEAHRQAEQGHLTRAAETYAQFIKARSLQVDNAHAALKDLIDNRCAAAPGEEAAGVFKVAARLTADAPAYPSVELVQHGLQIVQAMGDKNLRGAIALLDVLRTLSLDARDINAARLPLLQKWVAAEPENVDAAVALASLLVDQDKFDEASKLIVPFKGKLGNGEGARVLGAIYVRDGKFDDAYAVLLPYVKPRLESLHATEQSAEQIYESAWQHEVQVLKDDKGPPDFYQRLNQASSDQQDAIVRRYVQDRLKDNPRIREATEAMEKQEQVVPVVLELGMVMLQRAQGTANPVERKKQLEEAQNVFLSIQSAAGESDQYRLFLGQVYFWLGKQAEGQALFDQYLAAKGRSFQSLLQIAHTLRNVGDDSAARIKAEEAYNKATTSADRYIAAQSRSLIEKDLDDEIEWLQKSDPADPRIKSTLANAVGHRAMREGRDDEAATQFRAALDACNDLPRNEATFNQISLASYSLYGATGDPKDLARSVDAIQQAVALNQSDAVLLYNAGVTVTESTLTDVIGKRIDLHALHSPAEVQALAFLYRDEAQRAALAKQLADHPGFAKSMAYLDKVMVVSPKADRGYGPALALQSTILNDAGLRAIEQRIKTADIDTGNEVRQTQEFLAGTNDGKDAVRRAAALKRYETAATQARAAGGPTLAMALDMQAATLLQRDQTGGTADPDKILQLTSDAHAAAPSKATHFMLIGAYEFRTFEQLRAADPALDQFAKQYYRALGVSHMLAVLVQQNGPMGKVILAHPDYQKALTLYKENMALFPTDASGLTWAIFSVADPAVAQKQAAILRDVPHHAIIQNVSLLLSPASGSEALDAAWIAQALGKPDEARTVLTRTTALGTPLPQMR